MSRYTKGERQGVIVIVIVAVALTVTGYLLRGCGSGNAGNTFERVVPQETVISTKHCGQDTVYRKKGSKRKKKQQSRKKGKAKRSGVGTVQPQRNWLRDTIPS